MNAEMSPKQAELNETRSHFVDRYLDELEGEDFIIGHQIAKELFDPGQPIADTIVIIPVAAHQEAPQIANTLYQYSKQKVDRPFTVVLGLNCPTDKAVSKEVADTMSAVEAAKREHPNLDIRTSFVTYDEPVIGRIKRDIWNGVALRAQKDGTVSNSAEVLGINHDVDLVRLGASYIRNVQDHYQQLDSEVILPEASPIRFTKTTHGTSPDHPNLSSAIKWNDFALRQNGQGFESGIILPLSKYAELDGINSEKRIGEILSLFYFRPSIIPATVMVTSPRRYIEHFEEHGYEIWQQDNFGANDKCRQVLNVPDVSKQRALEVIDESLAMFAEMVVERAEMTARQTSRRELEQEAEVVDIDELRIRTQEKYLEYASERQKLSMFILRRIVKSDELADKLGSLFAEELEELKSAYEQPKPAKRVRIVE